MPRDGANNYAPPPGTAGIPDTTIESAKYNSFVADISQDQNTPRPIVAGGTAATSADGALDNLSAEKFKQVVANWDSNVWRAGSFYATAAATGVSPIGTVPPTMPHAFAGIAYYANATDFVIEALDLTTGIKYIRTMTAGVWGAWTQQAGGATDLDAAYVNVTGDTMTGPLGLQYSSNNSVSLSLNNTFAGGHNWAIASSGGGPGPLGSLVFYDSTAGGPLVTFSGGPAGGVTVAGALAVTGIASITGGIASGSNVTATGTFTSAATSTAGTYWFGNGGTKYLTYDGTNFTLNGGNVKANAGFWSITGINTGTYFFGNGTPYLTYDGTSFTFVGGNVIASGNGFVSSVAASPTNTGIFYFGTSLANAFYFDGTWFQVIGGPLQATGHRCRSGVTGAFEPQAFNLYYNAGPVQLWIDSTNMGNITVTSDYRIKKDVIDLPGMWDTVKALRPIKYTQAQFTPPSHVKYIAGEVLKAKQEAEENPDAKPREVNTAPLFPADDIERWGFIAHELQATLIESAATGVKDAPDTIQSPNPFTVIAALTRALQEAMARIEALEARP